jgi:pimeloyl-[acyl-carrier protein] methyl ester esterase
MPIKLVFIPGWGLDAHFWDALSELLSQFPQVRVDLGFFGALSEERENSQPCILIGHSLGFFHGLKERQDWRGWIAINGFLRFTETGAKTGCVTQASLRAMRRRLQSDPSKTIQDFCRLIGTPVPDGMPNFERLREGLDELSQYDIEDILTEFNVPGLVLAGCNDPLVPLPASEALGRLAGHGGLRFHEKAGHLLPQTEPSWCARQITNFLATNFGPA